MKIKNNWKNFIKEEKSKPYYAPLIKRVTSEYRENIIYPEEKNIFRAFELCDFKDLKLVILGQDPYHGKGEADGLAFSTPKLTPSLRNIFKALESDLGIKRDNPKLDDWAKQGVLLLNTILTVKEDSPLSHKNIGWEEFSLNTIKHINKEKENIVFLLWGKNAEKYQEYIDENKHLIIISSHPSPFSARRSFLETKHFSTSNEYLEKHNKSKINWR